MTLSQSLSPPQVAHIFPLLLKYVLVSTMSHQANCIVIPFRLKLFVPIVHAERFVFQMRLQHDAVWMSLVFNAAPYHLLGLVCFSPFSIYTLFSLQQTVFHHNLIHMSRNRHNEHNNLTWLQHSGPAGSSFRR